MKQNDRSQKYEVMAELSSIPLSKAKNSFQITYGKLVIGTLEFSKGSIRWYAKNAKKTSKPTCKMNWKKFADFMEKTNK